MIRPRRPFSSRRGVFPLALVLGCALLVPPPAWASPRPAGQGSLPELVIQDDLGRSRRISASPTRVVVLGGFAAETLCALGLGERIVARSEWVTWPPAAAEKPSLGSHLQPNLELLAALGPELVIADPHFYSGIAARMEQIGAPVLFLKGYDLSDLRPAVLKLGRIFDRTNRAERLVSFAEKHLALVKGRLSGLPRAARPKAFYGFGKEVFFTYSDKSRHPHLLRLAGGENVAAGLPAAVSLVSPEWLVAADPQVMVLSARLQNLGFRVADRPHMAALWQRMAGRPGLRGLACVRQGRFHIINSRLVYGPRAAIGLLHLAKWLNPEVFADLSPEKIHAEFLAEFYNLPLSGAYVYP